MVNGFEVQLKTVSSLNHNGAETSSLYLGGSRVVTIECTAHPYRRSSSYVHNKQEFITRYVLQNLAVV